MIVAPKKHPVLNGVLKTILQAIVPTALGAIAAWVLSIENRTQAHERSLQRIDTMLQDREDKLDQVLERVTQIRLDVARIEERLAALARR